MHRRGAPSGFAPFCPSRIQKALIQYSLTLTGPALAFKVLKRASGVVTLLQQTVSAIGAGNGSVTKLFFVITPPAHEIALSMVTSAAPSFCHSEVPNRPRLPHPSGCS